MAAIGTGYMAPVLNFLLQGSSIGAPAAWVLALGSAVPAANSVVSTWEIGTGSGYSAQTVGFAVAVTPNSSVTNTNAQTMGPFSSSQSISGAMIKNTSATGGTNIFWGSLATAATFTPGESIIFASGSLACSIT